MLYQFNKTIIEEGRSHKYILFKGNNRLLYVDFLTLLQQDRSFQSFYVELLSGVPFRAYQWETPPVTSKTKDRPFEFVTINNPAIDLPPDPGPFRQYFNSDNGIAVFSNLGNDARLIAPAPLHDRRKRLNYSHIGRFTKAAPLEQQQLLWQTVAGVAEELISDRPLWLNTAGGGVAWLHVRLDSRPKYYRHGPYKTMV